MKSIFGSSHLRTPFSSTRVAGVIVAAAMLISAHVANATTYYVANTGNDNAVGSSIAPWKTLQHAADNVHAGDTVIVRAGNYTGFILGWDFPTAGTANARIVFSADPAAAPGTVVINARNNKTPVGIDLEPDCDYITLDGFKVIGAGGIATYPNRGSGIKIAGSNDIVVNCTVSNLDYGFGIIADNATNVLLKDNTVVGTGSHGNGNYGHAIYVAGSIDGAVVRGNNLHNNDYIGIHVNGDISQGGIGLVTHALIENNIIYSNGQNGINADGLQSSTIRNNLIFNYEGFGIVLYQIDAAAGSTNNLIVNNTIYAGSGSGAAVRILDGATGTTILNNILLGGSNRTLRISDDSLVGLTSDYNSVSSQYQSEDSGDDETFAQWKSETGKDAHSFIASGAQLFVSLGGNDYHLSATSPALDTGTASHAPSSDLEGSPRPSGPGFDIGAYEASSDQPGPSPSPSPSPPPTDSTPPTVTITSPTNGATVSHVVTVQGLATDNTAVTLVELYVDGILTASGSPTFSFPWDSSGSAEGNHTFTVRAYDAAGMYGDALVTVNVDNVPTPTGPSVTIVHPSAGPLPKSSTGVIAVGQAAPGGLISKVIIAVDGKVKKTCKGNGHAAALVCSYKWSRIRKGAHIIAAATADQAGMIAVTSIAVSR